MMYSAFRLQLASRRPDLPLEEVDRAYEFAKKAHGDQLRYSGEPYIVHPVAVAEILLIMNPDLASIQAALLHDVTEDTDVTSAQVEAEFGLEVAKLVEGMDKLAVVKVRAEDSEGEKWRKMFLAMASDVRIVFIKLADRLHNMRTLQFVPLQKQERIARETLLVHAAIASRLGIYEIKSQLEDLCFEYLYPQEFKELSEQLASMRERSDECMTFATSQLEQLLFREGVRVDLVQGRMKHLWSIFQKLEKKEQGGLESIYDLFAVRIVLPDSMKDGKEEVGHVYSTLGLIHSQYAPLQDRFKDYIAVPKPNGYRSLHTTVLGLGGELYQEPTEVQIRTVSMHKEAELGIASHWSYKSGQKRAELREQEQMLWLRSLADAAGAGALDSHHELNLYSEHIFVLTPTRAVVELPRGATPIDFAYALHTELGHKMISAKVNGRIVPFDYELQNGEMVEVVTRANGKPSMAWLPLVHTASARNKIRNWFHRQERAQAGEGGKAAVEGPAGAGAAVVEKKKEEIYIPPAELTEKVVVTGEENLPVVFSSCCKPRPPYPIIGYVTRGHSIRIHRLSCRELSGLDGERFVSAHWKERG